MRWDRLFADLEGQLESELSAEERDLRVEEERLRLGRLTLRDRLLALHEHLGRDTGYTLALQLVSGETLALHPSAFGRDWFAADVVDASPRTPAEASAQCIVPLASIASLLLSSAQVEASLTPLPGEAGPVSLSARLTLPFVLRDLCRRRAGVGLRLDTGDVHGTIDRVGRDHLDLAVHEAGRPRRQSAVLQHRVVPLDRLLFVRV